MKPSQASYWAQGELSNREVAKFAFKKRETWRDFIGVIKGDFSNAQCKTTYFHVILQVSSRWYPWNFSLPVNWSLTHDNIGVLHFALHKVKKYMLKGSGKGRFSRLDVRPSVKVNFDWPPPSPGLKLIRAGWSNCSMNELHIHVYFYPFLAYCYFEYNVFRNDVRIIILNRILFLSLKLWLYRGEDGLQL